MGSVIFFVGTLVAVSSAFGCILGFVVAVTASIVAGLMAGVGASGNPVPHSGNNAFQYDDGVSSINPANGMQMVDDTVDFAGNCFGFDGNSF